MKCQARQQSDQMACHQCGLVWDMNDPDPPKCRSAAERARDEVKAMGLATPDSDRLASNWAQIERAAQHHLVARAVLDMRRYGSTTELALTEGMVLLLKQNTELTEKLLTRMSRER